MSTAERIFADYRWLPHHIDATGNRIEFVRLKRDDHRRVTFLEDKYLGPALERVVLPLEDVAMAAQTLKPAPLRFVFHSSFALSTLMARVFDRPGLAMGLKEPVILNEIGALFRKGRRVGALLDTALRLLGRPFGAGEAVVIKPGNMANVLIPEIMARSDARALLMYAPLPDFLQSIARRGMFGRAIYRRNFALLNGDGVLNAGFSEAELFEQTDLQIAAMAWLNHQAQFGHVLTDDRVGQYRSLASDAMLAAPQAAVAAAGQHLGVALDAGAIVAGPLFGEHAKELGRSYNAEDRRRDVAATAVAHGEEIAMVVTWAEIVAAQQGVPMRLPVSLLD